MQTSYDINRQTAFVGDFLKDLPTNETVSVIQNDAGSTIKAGLLLAWTANDGTVKLVSSTADAVAGVAGRSASRGKDVTRAGIVDSDYQNNEVIPLIRKGEIRVQCVTASAINNTDKDLYVQLSGNDKGKITKTTTNNLKLAEGSYRVLADSNNTQSFVDLAIHFI